MSNWPMRQYVDGMGYGMGRPDSEKWTPDPRMYQGPPAPVFVEECGCHTPTLSSCEDAAEVCRKLDAMSRALRAQYALNGPGGPIAWGASKERQEIARYTGEDQYRGGLVTTLTGVGADDATAGTILVLTFDPVDEARIRGTIMQNISFNVGANTVNGGAWFAQAQRINVTMFINGSTTPQIQRVPLSALVQQANGDRRALARQVMLPTSAVVRVELRVQQTLTGLAGQSSEISATLDCGISPDDPGVFRNIVRL